jgi:hypothetical protein
MYVATAIASAKQTAVISLSDGRVGHRPWEKYRLTTTQGPQLCGRLWRRRMAEEYGAADSVTKPVDFDPQKARSGR